MFNNNETHTVWGCIGFNQHAAKTRKGMVGSTRQESWRKIQACCASITTQGSRRTDKQSARTHAHKSVTEMWNVRGSNSAGALQLPWIATQQTRRGGQRALSVSPNVSQPKHKPTTTTAAATQQKTAGQSIATKQVSERQDKKQRALKRDNTKHNTRTTSNTQCCCCCHLSTAAAGVLQLLQAF